MAEQPTYTEALAEVQRLLAAKPLTPASSNPPEQIGERIFPSIGVKALRDNCGSPDNLLATAMDRLNEAKNLQGPFARPAIEDALDLIALARFWFRAEAWRPMPLEIRKATQVVTGRHPGFVRATSKQPPRLFDLRWWAGERR